SGKSHEPATIPLFGGSVVCVVRGGGVWDHATLHHSRASQIWAAMLRLFRGRSLCRRMADVDPAKIVVSLPTRTHRTLSSDQIPNAHRAGPRGCWLRSR